MNNKIIIWVVAGVVVVGGAAWFLIGRSPSPSATTNGPTQAAPAANTGSQMSLKSLLALGTSQKCTFSNTDTDGTQVNGTVFVSSGHMRGDFVAVNSTGQTVNSHMISDGTTSWVWTDQMAQGVKMSFSSMSQNQEGSAQSHSIDPNQTMNYSCGGWSADQSEFTLPTNITFADMSALMQGAGASAGASAGAGAAGGSNAAMCAECNAITNAAGKAQCLAAMGCK